MIRDTVFFDLDGTLLPLDMDAYVAKFLELLSKLDFSELEGKAFNEDVLNKAFQDMISSKHPDKTNETAYFDSIEKHTNIKRKAVEPIFIDFYQNHFHKLKFASNREPAARKVIDILKSKGYKIVLATNPLFPKIATKTRLGWAGLSEDDFSYITTFDNSCFSKPHLEYYLEILDKLTLDAKSCYMVGNNIEEDLCAIKLGFKAFLLTDHIIGDIRKAPECEKGNYLDLINWAESLPKI
jgi:HAD superfamily hydrolase (TIGR01549 family)